MTAAGVFYQLRDYPKLIETSKEGVATNPNEGLEHLDLGIGYLGTGNFGEAIAEFKKAVELSSGDQDAAAFLLYAYAVSGDRAAAMKILKAWEARKDAGSPYIMATMYASLGMNEKAFQYLDRAVSERSLELTWHIKADPRIDGLRSDPRFLATSRQIGLP